MNREQILQELGDIPKILKTSQRDIFSSYRKHLNLILPWIIRFMGMSVPIQKAKGPYLYGPNGERYVDFIAGFGALNFGYAPDEVLKAIREVDEYPSVAHTFLSPLTAKLAEYLNAITPEKLSRVFFSNSGAEAIEAAIKLARASSKNKILLSTTGSFHGKTMGALSVSGREKYKKPFEPLLPGVKQVPYGDLPALETELKKGDVAGFLLEPIQGEGGVILPPDGYLRGAAALCQRYHAPLILDEIQTGMGRTGKIFCFEHEGVEPDILVLSKSLSAGMIPLGATITTDEIWKRAYGSMETSLLHTSTFGGNARAMAAGIAAIRLLLEKNLDAHAAEMGEHLIKGLKTLQKKHSVIKEVRGKGLIVGLSFDHKLGNKKGELEGMLTLWIARNLFKQFGIISGFTLNNYNILRVEPPIIVEREDIDYFLNGFDSILTALKTDLRLKTLQTLMDL